MKVVMIGVGGFGGHRRMTMRETGLFEILAAYDLNPQKLREAQEQDGARPVGSYEELLNVSGAEAVVISTGGKFHAQQIIAAARKGLHVYVEKPLCSTPQEVRDILAVQKETGRVIGVGHGDHSTEAASVAIKEMIDSGRLGKIATFEKTTAHSGGLEIKPGDWRGDPEKNPGGMLFQCGVHGLHELMFFFGPIQQVSAMMRYDVHTTQTADVAICHLRFASGLIGTLNAYHVTPYRHTLSIFGTKAALYRDDRYFTEGTKLLLQERKANQYEPQTPVEIPAGGDHNGNLRSFYKAVREGSTCYPSVIDGARAVAVVFAAEQSAKTGRAVDIDMDLVR